MRWLAILAALAGPAAADVRPVQRPDAAVAVLSAAGAVREAGGTTPDASARPVPRVPARVRDAREAAAVRRAPAPVIDAAGGVRRSIRPDIRPPAPPMPAAPASTPAAVRQASAPAASDGAGGLCGRASIRGTVIAPVVGAGGCGIAAPVRVTQVSGLALTRPARMDCETATALDTWVRNGVIPTVGARGGGAVALGVAAGYSCRTRNNRPGARMSEHGLGRAIDVAGIRLADGGEISVARDWGGGTEGRMLRAMWRAACGPFGTVLGPEADRYHRDHFHFDTARYRSGSYCR